MKKIGKILLSSIIAFSLSAETLLDGRQIKDNSIEASTKIKGVLGTTHGGLGSATPTADNLTEGSTNLYWTPARGLNNVLSGFSLLSGNITSSDSVLTAFERTQYQLNHLPTLASFSAISPIFYNNSTGVISSQSASGSQNGYLLSSDWTLFNNKPNLSSFSATSPIFYNSSTGIISSQAATSLINGYLTFTDWNTFNNKQNALTTGTTGQYFRGDLSLATFPTNISVFTNDSRYLTSNAVSSVFGRTGAITAQTGDYSKANVGLANVDNTSDINKPVSTSQQTALDLKANLISPNLVTPALGTPSGGVMTNVTGTATGLTAGNATNAVNTGITDDTTTNSTMYPTWVTANTGNLPQKTTSTKLTFNPSTGNLSSTSFTGNLTGNVTGNAATATALQTARTINGTNFDGTGNITVTAAGNTLTGSSLASGITSSSLTSLGTISTGTWNGTAILDAYIASATTWNAKQNALPSLLSGKYLTNDGTNLSWGTVVSGFANPMTTAGDFIYGGTSGAATRLAPNSTATKKYLSMTSSVPAWNQPTLNDILAPTADFAFGSQNITGTANITPNSNGTRDLGSGSLFYNGLYAKFPVFNGGQADFDSNSNTASSGSLVRIRRSRGTYASPTATLSGDELGGVDFSGYDAGYGDYARIARVFSEATQNTGSSTGYGSRIKLQTYANGLSFATNTWVFDQDGSTALPGKLNLASIASTTTAGDIFQDSSQKQIGVYVNSLKEMLTGTIFTQTASTTITNTTTETSIIGTGIGTKSLPTTFFLIGKQIHLHGSGIYSTPASVTSMIINVKYGSTVIGTVTTSALMQSATNQAFNFDADIVCRATGTTGTVMMDGNINYAVGSGVARITDAINNSGNTTTINTTTANALDVTVQWDSATTSRSITGIMSRFEVLN